jgi:hypothetical protein
MPSTLHWGNGVSGHNTKGYLDQAIGRIQPNLNRFWSNPRIVERRALTALFSLLYTRSTCANRVHRRPG